MDEFTDIAENLEVLFSDRGLKFTVPFSGPYPVVAYGWLDGMRFVFKFKALQAVLNLGTFNAEAEERDQKLHSDAVRTALTELPPESRKRDFLHDVNIAQTGEEPDYYPNPVLFSVYLNNLRDPVTGVYLGNELEPADCLRIFSQLVNMLDDEYEAVAVR